MATKTLFDLLVEEKDLLENKRRLEFSIMCLHHKHEETQCFPEYSHDSIETIQHNIETSYERLNELNQKIPDVQREIKDTMKMYENVDFVSSTVFEVVD